MLPCEPCQYSQKSTPSYREPPRSLPTPTKPWARIAIDVHGPYGHAPGHQRFVVTLMDHYSGWVEYLLCSETSSRTVIQWLKEVFSRFGLCEELVSDNGSNFCSSEFESFLSACGIRHLRSPVYHPQGNGQLEVFHRDIKHAVQGFEEGRGWKEQLDTKLAQYRFTERADGRASPARMLFGWQPRRSFVPAGKPREVKKPSEPVGKKSEPVKKHEVTEQTPRMDGRADREYLLRRGPFRAGDEVLVKIPPAKVLKGRSPWKGPLRVVQVMGDYTYHLSDGQVWHRREMKRYFRRPVGEVGGVVGPPPPVPPVIQHEGQ